MNILDDTSTKKTFLVENFWGDDDSHDKKFFSTTNLSGNNVLQSFLSDEPLWWNTPKNLSSIRKDGK